MLKKEYMIIHIPNFGILKKGKDIKSIKQKEVDITLLLLIKELI
jgi:tmRNA-binding protein